MRDAEAQPLWEAYRAEPTIENRNRIVEYYYGLIRLAATPMLARAPAWQPTSDLLGYGAIGLIQAVERYDTDAGVTFATFATRRIQGAILDGQRVEDPLTRTARRKLTKAVGAMSCDGMENVTNADLAAASAETDMTPGEITSLMSFAQRYQAPYSQPRASGDVGLSSGGEDSDSAQDGRWLMQQDETETAVEALAFADMLAGRLAQMSDQERTFVIYHYGEDLGLRALQEVLGVSDARLAKVRLNIVKALTYARTAV